MARFSFGMLHSWNSCSRGSGTVHRKKTCRPSQTANLDSALALTCSIRLVQTGHGVSLPTQRSKSSKYCYRANPAHSRIAAQPSGRKDFHAYPVYYPDTQATRQAEDSITIREHGWHPHLKAVNFRWKYQKPAGAGNPSSATTELCTWQKQNVRFPPVQ